MTGNEVGIVLSMLSTAAWFVAWFNATKERT